jgi:hypothetical protein
MLQDLLLWLLQATEGMQTTLGYVTVVSSL